MADWRTGRKVGRTIYRDEVLVGVMDTPELAAQVVDAISAREAAREGVTGWFMTNDEYVRLQRQAYERGRREHDKCGDPYDCRCRHGCDIP